MTTPKKSRKRIDLQQRSPRFLSDASDMPPLPHHPDRPAVFDPYASRVIQYLACTKSGADLLLDAFHKSGAIHFNEETGMWQGTNTTGNV